jgi:hypothetical protein
MSFQTSEIVDDEPEPPVDLSGVIDLETRVRILAAVADGTISEADFRTACASSLYFFCATCLFVFEPRSDDPNMKDIPFTPRSFQKQYLDVLQNHLDTGEDLLTDKSREMGVTWMVLMAFFWKWLFDPKFTAIVSSMTVEKIDRKGDPSCLFWKLEYLVECLKWTVPFLYPKGFKLAEPHRVHLKMSNPETKSVIMGETMGANLGRSGRTRAILLDEFAEAEYPEAAWASCSRTSECRIVVFTPKGMNFAGRLANPKRGEPASINRITLHWMIDETKNHYEIFSGQTGKLICKGNGEPDPDIFKQHPYALPPVYPWYEDAKRRVGYDPVKIAQELDVNYTESVDGIMYPQIERARFGNIRYDPGLALYLSMDYGLSDDTAMIWFQWDHRSRRFRVIDSFKKNGKTIRWYVPFITGRDIGLGQVEGGYTSKELGMIERHSAFFGRYTDFFGDPAGKLRNQVTNTSVVSELAKAGIYVRSNSKANSYEARRSCMSRLLPICDFDADRCGDLIEDIRNSRMREGGDGRSIPMHGPESHFRTAFEFFCVNQPHGFDGGNVTESSIGGIIQTSENQGVVYVPYNGKMIEVSGRNAAFAMRDLNEQMRQVDAESESRWASIMDADRRSGVSAGW